jgi:chromate reductase, NAD(P)H dehydrogenase (quinone)
LLISGSLREGSTNSAVLRTVRVEAPDDVDCVLYDESGHIPLFNPDDDRHPLHPAVVRLRAFVHSSDAILFSTPEYAGALPGSLKNLLEWLIGDDHPGSIYEKPVAWVNASPRGAVLAHQSLKTVLGYAKASVVEEACVDVPVTATALGDDGFVADRQARETLRYVARILRDFACRFPRLGT